MHTYNRQYLPFILGMALSTGVFAQALPKAEYKAEREKISADHRVAKQACKSQAGNAADICNADVRGREKVAKAELEYRNTPNQGNHTKVLMQKAESAYNVAKERCDDQAGNLKDVCIKEAKAAETTAKADARVQKISSDANSTVRNKTKDARNEAAEEKSEAQFQVAKEKCGAFSDLAKDRCLSDAETRFGKK
jgi:hypothetical protein